MKRRKIYFRADASETIGYGHFIRSLALADMLKEDFDITFFTQSPSEYQCEQVKNVCNLILLSSDNRKFDDFLSYLNGDEIVVLDNYFYSSDYQKRIKDKGCKLVYIDDIHDKHFYADVIINHGDPNREDYSVEPYCKLCLGNQWSLLREPFLKSQDKKSQDNNKNNSLSQVAICFGGSDKLGFTDMAIKVLIEFTQIKSIDVIVGSHYIQKNIYPDKVHFYSNISASDVAAIFCSSELAVVSLSSVSLEAMACGTKVVAGWYVENQHIGYESALKKKLIYGIGELPQGFLKLKKIVNNFDALPPLNKLDTMNIKSNYINLFSSLV